MANSTTIGALTMKATINCIGYRAAFTNDDNQNNSATVRFKLSSGSTWHDAYPPIIDRRVNVTDGTGASVSNTANVNQARGSIFGLTENTSYDVEVTWVDPDNFSNPGANPVTTSITTAPSTPPTGGTNYYVKSTGGSDSNNGQTEGAAWSTIAHALAASTAGDTINLDGTFAAFTISVSGNSGAYRKIQPTSGHTATISGGTDTISVGGDFLWFDHLALGASSTGSLVNVGGHHNIYITNCTASDFATTGTTMTGAVRMSVAHDIFILSNTFTRTSTAIADPGSPGTNGIALQGENYNIVINGNTLDGTMWDAIGNDTNSHIDNVDNCDFSNNRLMNYWDDAIEMDGGGINLRVWGNYIETSTVPNSKNSPNFDNGGDGISDAGTLVGPSYVVRNYVICHESYPIKGGHYALGYSFYFHNTVVCLKSGSGYQALTQAGGPAFSQNHVMRNNIFLSINNNVWTQEGNRSGNSYDYDILFQNTGSANVIDSWDTTGAGASVNYATFALFQADNDGSPFAAQEVHGKYGDPGLDTSYHIGSTSIAHDAGVSLANFNTADSAWPFADTAPDIGAFEFGTPAPPPSSPSGALKATMAIWIWFMLLVDPLRSMFERTR